MIDIFSFSDKNDTAKKDSCVIPLNHALDKMNDVDLEDIVNKTSTSPSGPRPIVRSYEVNKEQHSAKLSSLAVSNDSCNRQQLDGVAYNQRQPLMQLRQHWDSTEHVDRNVDYQGWLEVKKRKWKETREERKRCR